MTPVFVLQIAMKKTSFLLCYVTDAGGASEGYRVGTKLFSLRAITYKLRVVEWRVKYGPPPPARPVSTRQPVN